MTLTSSICSMLLVRTPFAQVPNGAIREKSPPGGVDSTIATPRLKGTGSTAPLLSPQTEQPTSPRHTAGFSPLVHSAVCAQRGGNPSMSTRSRGHVLKGRRPGGVRRPTDVRPISDRQLPTVFSNTRNNRRPRQANLHLERSVDSDVGTLQGLPQRRAGHPEDLARDGAVHLKERVHRVAQIREVLKQSIGVAIPLVHHTI
jgi:hypothetical protein